MPRMSPVGVNESKATRSGREEKYPVVEKEVCIFYNTLPMLQPPPPRMKNRGEELGVYRCFDNDLKWSCLYNEPLDEKQKEAIPSTLTDTMGTLLIGFLIGRASVVNR